MNDKTTRDNLADIGYGILGWALTAICVLAAAHVLMWAIALCP